MIRGVGLVTLFGNRGLMKDMLFGASIHGPVGIVIGSVFFTFAHAFIIISTVPRISDARLCEAASSLHSHRPGAKAENVSRRRAPERARMP